MPKIMKADPGYADLDDERIERAVDVAGFDRCALARGKHETRSCPPFDAASLVAEQCSGGNPLVASWAAVYFRDAAVTTISEQVVQRSWPSLGE